MRNIIPIINVIVEQYLKFELSVRDLEHYGEINFSKYINIVANIDSSISSNFNNLLYYYRKSLNYFELENYENFNRSISGLCSTSLRLEKRVKNTKTISEKIERYTNDEKIKGNVPINKCLNDIMGYRLIIEYNGSLEDFESEIESLLKESHLYSHELRYRLVKRVLQKKESAYKAVHLNIRKNNLSFPWEIQFWRMKDEVRNRKAHRLYKQDHLNIKHQISVVKKV